MLTLVITNKSTIMVRLK